MTAFIRYIYAKLLSLFKAWIDRDYSYVKVIRSSVTLTHAFICDFTGTSILIRYSSMI